MREWRKSADSSARRRRDRATTPQRTKRNWIADVASPYVVWMLASITTRYRLPLAPTRLFVLISRQWNISKCGVYFIQFFIYRLDLAPFKAVVLPRPRPHPSLSVSSGRALSVDNRTLKILSSTHTHVYSDENASARLAEHLVRRSYRKWYSG